MKFTLFSSLLLLGSAAAFGQSFDASISGGASVITNNSIGQDIFSSGATASSQVRLNNGFRLAFRLGFDLKSHIGAEVGYAYNRSQLHFDGPPVTEQGFGIHQGFADALYYFSKENFRIRPFVAGGIHFSNFVPPGSSAQYGQGENKFGVNYGAGVKARLGEKWELRGDFRQYEQGKPFGLGGSGRLFLNEISVGFGIVI
ncbi:MAG: outer membrane beta-barrel protein [Acidobacteriaceae bacterium]|nr:outer membrane beta-barrel protein [Acidobacteriaceae bacterium]